MVNRTLIDRLTNEIIGRRPPSQYLQDIRSAGLPGYDLEAVLASHYLPNDEGSSLWLDDYDAFRQDRAAAIHNLILEATRR